MKQDLDGVVYQETPQPSHPNFRNGDRIAVQAGYVNGKILGNSGHLSVKVSADRVKVDYVRTYLPNDERDGWKNGEVSYSYTIGAE